MDENQFQLLATEVKGALELLAVKMDDIKEKQEEVAAIVNRVEKSLYEPDQGLYARVRDLEQWKKSQSKMMAMVGTATLSMVAYFLKTFVEFIIQ
jgi:tetrahydromethanopterin S-methyltransferase subunit B